MAAVNHRTILDGAARGVRVVAPAFTTSANIFQAVQWPPDNLLGAVYLSVAVADGRYCGPAVAGSATDGATDGAAATPSNFPILIASGAEAQLYAQSDPAGEAVSPANSRTDFVTTADATTKFHYVYVRK